MPLDALSPPQPGTGALHRIGTLSARKWRAKLYAPALAAGGLRPEDLAAAERAYRAGIAGPVAAPTAGFALLRPDSGDGSLVFSAHWWEEGAELHRTSLLLPVACLGWPPGQQARCPPGTTASNARQQRGGVPMPDGTILPGW